MNVETPAAENLPSEVAKPLYRRMKEDLLRRILSGEWRPGELVPSEVALAQEYSVSVGTARKAIEELVVERLIVRQRGRGTTIARADRYEPFRSYRLHIDGKTRAEYSTLYLSCIDARATSAEAKGLNVPRGTPVIRVRRLRCHEGQPAVYESLVLKRDRFPDGAAIINNVKPEGLHRLLERAFHVIVPRAHEQVRVANANQEDAEVLNVIVGTPLLSVDRQAFALDGDIVEFRRMKAITGVHYANDIAF
jgi:GntR family transcriptional regulator